MTVPPVPENLAAFIDHTILRADAGVGDVRQLCEEARAWGFASVCVNSSFVPLCAELLRGSSTRVCTVAGFPLGASSTAAKAAEARHAVEQGAGEVDMVLHVGRLKGGDDAFVAADIAELVRRTREVNPSTIVKVILETCLLTDDEKRRACALVRDEGADFVKTSTGFGGGGATTDDVALMRSVVGPSMGVKASGGIKSLDAALAMIAAGATRIGTSSGVAIIQQFESSRSNPS